MALIHRADLVPSKLDLLRSWVPARAWLGDVDAGSLETLGAYRFDDPDGEVGIETHLLRAADGRVLQVPWTYRGAPLEGAEAALVSTMEHSVLGRRWVYDAVSDPVYLAALVRTIATGGRQADLERDGGGTWPPSATVQGSGSAEATVPPLTGAVVRDGDGVTTIDARTVSVTLLRVLDQPVATGDSTLTGAWPDSGAPHVLATLRAGAGTGRRRLVELSHVISAGMTTYPGLPAPEIEPHLTRERSRSTYAPGTEFAIDRLSMVGNTGTYLDTPFHRYADGYDLAGLELARVVDLPTVVVRTVDGPGRGVAPAAFAGLDVAGAAVLLHTGGDAGWGTDAYAVDAPFLTAEGARWLVDHGAALVGIDSVNIDEMTPRGERPAHTLLLAAGIPIVEHLTGLDRLPPSGARFTAAPPRVAGFGTFPVRAFAIVGG